MSQIGDVHGEGQLPGNRSGDAEIGGGQTGGDRSEDCQYGRYLGGGDLLECSISEGRHNRSWDCIYCLTHISGNAESRE